MGRRALEIKVISAKDLKNVNLLSKMEVYVVVSIAGGAAAAEQKTAVDRDGGTHPTWNHSMKFTIEESSAMQNRLTLVFRLRCRRILGGDRDIGEVNVPVKDLLSGKGNQLVSYEVKKPSGKPQGVLNFSYKSGETKAAPALGRGKAAAPPVRTASPPARTAARPQQKQGQYKSRLGMGAPVSYDASGFAYDDDDDDA